MVHEGVNTDVVDVIFIDNDDEFGGLVKEYSLLPLIDLVFFSAASEGTRWKLRVEAVLYSRYKVCSPTVAVQLEVVEIRAPFSQDVDICAIHDLDIVNFQTIIENFEIIQSSMMMIEIENR